MQNPNQMKPIPCAESISALVDGELHLAECEQLLTRAGDGAHLEQLRVLASYEAIGAALRGQAAVTQVDASAFVQQWRSRMAMDAHSPEQRAAQPAANDARWKWVVGLASFAMMAVGVGLTGLRQEPSSSQAAQVLNQQSSPAETFAQARAKRNLVLTPSERGPVWRDPELDALLLQQRLAGDNTVIVPATTVRHGVAPTRADK